MMKENFDDSAWSELERMWHEHDRRVEEIAVRPPSEPTAPAIAPRRRWRYAAAACAALLLAGVWLLLRQRPAEAPLVARSEAVPAQRAEVLPPQEEASTARKEAAVPAKAMPAAQPLSELPPEAETATGTSAASAAAEPAEPIAADPSLLADNADMHPDAPTAQINVLCNQDACSSQGYSWIAYESIFKS